MKNRVVRCVFGGLLADFLGIDMKLPTYASAATSGGGPYSSQPLALSWDDSELAVVNPDANTVSIFQVAGDKNTKVAEVAVGKEPTGVAFSSDGTRLYVANRVDGTVSIVSQAAIYTGGWGCSPARSRSAQSRLAWC